jgi:hypothetical protein
LTEAIRRTLQFARPGSAQKKAGSALTDRARKHRKRWRYLADRACRAGWRVTCRGAIAWASTAGRGDPMTTGCAEAEDAINADRTVAAARNLTVVISALLVADPR